MKFERFDLQQFATTQFYAKGLQTGTFGVNLVKATADLYFADPRDLELLRIGVGYRDTNQQYNPNNTTIPFQGRVVVLSVTQRPIKATFPDQDFLLSMNADSVGTIIDSVDFNHPGPHQIRYHEDATEGNVKASGGSGLWICAVAPYPGPDNLAGVVWSVSLQVQLRSREKIFDEPGIRARGVEVPF